MYKRNFIQTEYRKLKIPATLPYVNIFLETRRQQYKVYSLETVKFLKFPVNFR